MFGNEKGNFAINSISFKLLNVLRSDSQSHSKWKLESLDGTFLGIVCKGSSIVAL